MNKSLNRHSGKLALVALVVSVLGFCLAGASASGVFVTSRQIKNGTILSQDLHNNGIKSVDVKNGTVSSADIGNGDVASADIGEGEVHTGDIGTNQVFAQDVNLPESEQLVETPANTGSAEVGGKFALVDEVGTYTKEVNESKLEIAWTGTVQASFVPPSISTEGCVFQLRVDGQTGVNSGGEVLGGHSTTTTSVAATSLFEVPAGPHQIQVYAKSLVGNSICIVGPTELGINQTFTVAEQVE